MMAAAPDCLKHLVRCIFTRGIERLDDAQEAITVNLGEKHGCDRLVYRCMGACPLPSDNPGLSAALARHRVHDREYCRSCFQNPEEMDIETKDIASRVVLRPGKSADFEARDLGELALEIGELAGSDVSVGIAEQRDSGPQPATVLHVVITLSEGYAFSHIVDVIIGWARSKWKERRDGSKASGEAPQPIIVNVEGNVSVHVKIDLPDGEPSEHDGPVHPRGERVGEPRWVAGPAAPDRPQDQSAAWIYPLQTSRDAGERLREELERSSFHAVVDNGPGPTVTGECGGPPLETIVRVRIADPFREDEALAAISRWVQALGDSDKHPYWASASVMDCNGSVLRRLTMPPGIYPPGRKTPGPEPDPAVVAVLGEMDLIRVNGDEVELWHATSADAAAAIQATGNLRCDDNGIAYLSTSDEIADVMRATGAAVDVLLKIRVPLFSLDISRDWRPGTDRVDFCLLCGQFVELPVTLVENRQA